MGIHSSMLLLIGSIFSVWSCICMILDIASLGEYKAYSSQYWRWGIFLNLFPGLVAYFFIFSRVVKKGTGNTLLKSVGISLSFPLLGFLFPLLPCVWLSYHGYYL